ncbi:MAG: hypothetical protein GY774_28055 [Planctomycetes bacterium]|nr:hypothetical protein [Planctomycetota bacterium]
MVHYDHGNKIKFLFAAFSVVFAIAGWFASDYALLGDTAWFGRSGAIITTLALLYNFSSKRSLHGVLDHIEDMSKLFMESKARNLGHDVNEALSAVDRVMPEVKNARELARYHFECTLIASGTLLWGFGDLLF